MAVLTAERLTSRASVCRRRRLSISLSLSDDSAGGCAQEARQWIWPLAVGAAKMPAACSCLLPAACCPIVHAVELLPICTQHIAIRLRLRRKRYLRFGQSCCFECSTNHQQDKLCAEPVPHTSRTNLADDLLKLWPGEVLDFVQTNDGKGKQWT